MAGWITPGPHPYSATPHAVARFAERYPVAGVPDTAESRLRRVMFQAVHVEDILDEGQQIWKSTDNGRTVLMVVRDGIVKTVLPTGSRRPAHRRRLRHA